MTRVCITRFDLPGLLQGCSRAFIVSFSQVDHATQVVRDLTIRRSCLKIGDRFMGLIDLLQPEVAKNPERIGPEIAIILFTGDIQLFESGFFIATQYQTGTQAYSRVHRIRILLHEIVQKCNPLCSLALHELCFSQDIQYPFILLIIF